MRAVVCIALLAALLPATSSGAQNDPNKLAARKISNHLQQSGQLKNYRIGVTYEDGVATLVGTVANAEQRDTAVRLAKQVPGVSRVICQLQHADDALSTVPELYAAETEAAGLQTQPQAPVATNRIVQAIDEKPSAGAGRRSNPPARSARTMPRNNMPLPAPRPGIHPAIRQVSAEGMYPPNGTYSEGPSDPMPATMGGVAATPIGFVPHGHGRGPSYENAQMPAYAWPSYASYPNYAALTYPRQYSPTAWPYIGPFYPYPQVPLAWRKVSLEWDDGWWFLDFSAHNSSH
jgi:hypothetical protein